MSFYDYLENEEPEDSVCCQFLGNSFRPGARELSSIFRLPGGKTVNLRLYTMPNEYEPGQSEFVYTKPRLRPVHIETFGQLMLLFVNDRYIDVFQRPEPQFDVRLTAEQRQRIAHALIA